VATRISTVPWLHASYRNAPSRHVAPHQSTRLDSTVCSSSCGVGRHLGSLPKGLSSRSVPFPCCAVSLRTSPQPTSTQRVRPSLKWGGRQPWVRSRGLHAVSRRIVSLHLVSRRIVSCHSIPYRGVLLRVAPRHASTRLNGLSIASAVGRHLGPHSRNCRFAPWRPASQRAIKSRCATYRIAPQRAVPCHIVPWFQCPASYRTYRLAKAGR
jgi:hypothetical protein